MWHRRFAMETNNAAWDLFERKNRAQADDERMVLSAYASAFHWAAIGNDDHRALSYSTLAHVHGTLGHAEFAKSYAERVHAFFNARESEAWKRAFAASGMALAAEAAGDHAAHAKHYAEAKALQADLSPGDREVFDKTFARIPVPPQE
jgi:hypothetical protein